MYNFEDIKDNIELVLNNSRVQDLKPVWEKLNDRDGYKWVLTLHRFTWDNANVLYTKIIVKTDSSKTKLLDNSFSYLYDLNCYYRDVKFSNLEDFKIKLERIFKDNKFGLNLKRISEFVVSPAMSLNEWLYKSKIDTISVFDFQYQPKFLILPCKKLSFDFLLNVNNKDEVNITIKRILTDQGDTQKEMFDYTFNYLDSFDTKQTEDLSTIVETIGSYLKSKFLKSSLNI